ncbi:MAG: putative serine protease PepD [Actinomycetota bacterium]|nr:putative serine protease PepD [Actinomycetota bacterium]
MSEDNGRQEPPADAPWWARPSGDAWDAPTHAAPPAQPQRPVPAGQGATSQPWHTEPGPTNPNPDPWQPDQPAMPSPGPWQPAPRQAYPGWDQRPAPGPRREGPRTWLLVLMALVIAVVAGVGGGSVGYLLAQHHQDLTVNGASLGTAPAGTKARPLASVAGIARRVLPSVVQIRVRNSQGLATGSGFVVDPHGFIITNNHVVADLSGRPQVTFADGRTTTGTVVGTSPSYDLAVLRVKATHLPALRLGNSISVVVGDPVIAIGSPLGLSGTVTSGIVSAVNRPVTAGGTGGSDSSYINAIQTDAAINPGNSGGPLVDGRGQVIGVNSAIATLGNTFGGESGNIGVGFAIPINQASRTAQQIIRTGSAQFPVIGASLDPSYNGVGARIAPGSAADGTPPLVPGGPAQTAGLQPGDVIVAIDGKRVADSSELIVAIRSHRPNQTVRLTLRRHGSERVVQVTLGAHRG